MTPSYRVLMLLDNHLTAFFSSKSYYLMYGPPQKYCLIPEDLNRRLAEHNVGCSPFKSLATPAVKVEKSILHTKGGTTNGGYYKKEEEQEIH